MSRPADFTLDLTGRTGSLPPRYDYRYRLQVGPDQVAHDTFAPGYADNGPSWTSEFHVSDAALDSPWTDFQASTLARIPFAPELAPLENDRSAVTERHSSSSRQHSYLMSARELPWNHPTADVAGPTGDERVT